MEFSTFHLYNKMVARGAAEPLRCEHCNTEFTLRLGAFDEPVLQCFGCGVLVTPGLRVYTEIRNAVNNYFGSNNVKED